jgi:hypothetical protein
MTGREILLRFVLGCFLLLVLGTVGVFLIDPFNGLDILMWVLSGAVLYIYMMLTQGRRRR